MNLYERIKRDIHKITTDQNGAGQTMKIITPLLVEHDIVGIWSKHHLAIDTDGNQVNSQNAHVSFTETSLIEVGLDVRSSKDITLTGYMVKCVDLSGLEFSYRISSFFPSDTHGLICCILKKIE